MRDDFRNLDVWMQRRRLLQASLAASVATFSPLAPLRAAATAPPFDAAVARTPLPGVRTFASVGEAIAAAPADGRSPFRILVTRGRWHEKLVVDRPWIHLVGEDRNASVLSFDAAAGMKRPDGEP
ncbi:hypothetical protein HIV01_012040 [Lysobacter arenosi]|uniref:Uncharacterized protein n=1 Tax=Lysobacter arenosi TaxID=2795387 RepID=A0ABX7R7H7_9GAMM|nr:hypothetical protein [Lysobacter arenosi]QSX73950.1 hypothetical protein HIV01_012040 [Lysobacter arenosi]